MGETHELSKELWKLQETTFTLKNINFSQVKSKLEELPYVNDFRIEKNKIYIYSEDGNQTTPLIVKKLVELGAEILEVVRTEYSLEDIYLKLMKEGHEAE